MNARTVLLIVVGARLCCCTSLGQGTFQVTFDGPPPQPPGTQYGVTSYYESGMWFSPIGPSDPANQFTRNGGGLPLYPEDGTPYLQAALGDSLSFGFQNSSLFGATSVDLAGYSTVLPDFNITFVGYRPNGSTITTSFSGSGIGFRTFYFSPEWASGLARVEVPYPAWSMDNLGVAIPEPMTAPLLVLAALLFVALKSCAAPNFSVERMAAGGPPFQIRMPPDRRHRSPLRWAL